MVCFYVSGEEKNLLQSTVNMNDLVGMKTIQFLKYMYSLMKIHKLVIKRPLPCDSVAGWGEVIGRWLSEKSLVSL